MRRLPSPDDKRVSDAEDARQAEKAFGEFGQKLEKFRREFNRLKESHQSAAALVQRTAEGPLDRQEHVGAQAAFQKSWAELASLANDVEDESPLAEEVRGLGAALRARVDSDR